MAQSKPITLTYHLLQEEKVATRDHLEFSLLLSQITTAARIIAQELRRAGLDYWHEVKLTLWDSLEELQAAQAPSSRYWYLTTKTKRAYWSQRFLP